MEWEAGEERGDENVEKWQGTEGNGKERCRKVQWVDAEGRDEEFRLKTGRRDEEGIGQPG